MIPSSERFIILAASASGAIDTPAQQRKSLCGVDDFTCADRVTNSREIFNILRGISVEHYQIALKATLHTSGIQLGHSRTFDDQLASLRRELAQVEPISAVLGAQLKRFVPRVSVYTSLSLVRRTLRSWQKIKPSRIESALALLVGEIAGLP